MGLPNSTASSLTEQRFYTGKIKGTSSRDGYLSYSMWTPAFQNFLPSNILHVFSGEKKNNWKHPSSGPLNGFL
jgi:hypothetical protein